MTDARKRQDCACHITSRRTSSANGIRLE